jgi:hypothetical protein
MSHVCKDCPANNNAIKCARNNDKCLLLKEVIRK